MNEMGSEQENQYQGQSNPFASPDGFQHIEPVKEKVSDKESRRSTRLLVGLAIPVPICSMVVLLFFLIIAPSRVSDGDTFTFALAFTLFACIVGILPSAIFSLYMEHLVRRGNNIVLQLFGGFAFGAFPLVFVLATSSPVEAALLPFLIGTGTCISAYILWRIADIPKEEEHITAVNKD